MDLPALGRESIRRPPLMASTDSMRAARCTPTLMLMQHLLTTARNPRSTNRLTVIGNSRSLQDRPSRSLIFKRPTSTQATGKRLTYPAIGKRAATDVRYTRTQPTRGKSIRRSFLTLTTRSATTSRLSKFLKTGKTARSSYISAVSTRPTMYGSMVCQPDTPKTVACHRSLTLHNYCSLARIKSRSGCIAGPTVPI